MSTENEKDQQDPVKRILQDRFGSDAFRDDEGDKDEPVKQRPAPIDSEAAREFRKRAMENFSDKHFSGDEDMGPHPSNTLAGAMVEERYGPNESNISMVRELRKSADTFRLTSIELGKVFPSRELSSAVTSFQVARQFLGKLMQQYGNPYPYPNADSKIADGGEVDKDIMDLLGGSKELEKFLSVLKTMRDKVETVIVSANAFFENISPANNLFEHACQMQVISELLKGKFWLGEIIGLGNKFR